MVNGVRRGSCFLLVYIGRTEIYAIHFVSCTVQLQNLSIKSVFPFSKQNTLYMITICETRGTLACISLHPCKVMDATK